MFVVEVYAAVRDFVFNQCRSRREAARVFGLSRETIAKMCRFSLPPGYTRTKPAENPKLGPWLPVIDAILGADRSAPVKQRHTANPIFERLRDEHGFAGGYTVVKDNVRVVRARGCDLVKTRIGDVTSRSVIRARLVITQRNARRLVRFEMTAIAKRRWQLG